MVEPPREDPVEKGEAACGELNDWEDSALNYYYSDTRPCRPRPHQDSIIYPGLYSPSGFNILDIFTRLVSRPMPRIELGPIDCSVSFIVCDLAKNDIPVVYVSGGFTQLTGYSSEDTLGRNCRFLQAPAGNVRRTASRGHPEEVSAVDRMRRAVKSNDEIQIDVVNYRKDGCRFFNHLTIIPLRWDSGEYRYSIGFMGDA